MKHHRALTPLVAVVAFMAPASAHAGSALGDTFSDATFGTLSKAVDTASGRGDASCTSVPITSQPFTRWNDKASYVEAPGGSFEAGAQSWSFSGGVSFAQENEPWRVSGRSSDARSVVLKDTNASIMSDPLCAGIQYPTLRFFARAPRGSALALVTARYTGPDGLLAALPVGVVSANSAWAPTNISLTASGVPGVTGTTLSIRIAPLIGTLQVDDVYVDPYRRS